MKKYILLLMLISVNYSFSADHDDRDDHDDHAQNKKVDEIIVKIGDIEVNAEKYQSCSDIVQNEKDFIKLSFDDIIAILKNPNFITDSEESVFTLMMLWLKAKQQELWGDNFSNVHNQEKLFFINTYLRPILDLIDFNRMSRFYLGYQVKSYLEEYDNYLYINVISNKISPLIKRKYDTNQYGIQVIFNKINNWLKQEKYYSHKTLINGLYFYIFLISINNGLAAYIRCVGEDNNKKNGLPVNISLKVINDKGEIERKFDDIKSVFTNYDSSIGLMISEKYETFDDIINDKTPLAKNNAIIVKVSIKFLDEIPYSIKNINEFPLGYPYEDSTKENIKNIPPKIMRAILERHLYILDEDKLLVIVKEWIRSKNPGDNDDTKFCESFYDDLKTNIMMSPLPYDDIRELWSEWNNIKNNPLSFINNPRNDDDVILFTNKLTSLLKSPYFAVDSEESVIYFVLDYIKLILATINNPKYFDIIGLLESINWKYADPFYVTCIEPVIKNINNPSLTYYYDQKIKKIEAINSILLTRTEDVNEYYRKLEEIKNKLISNNKRPKIISPNQISFKCKFFNVSQYDTANMRNSSPILIHGYLVTYFLQAKQDQEGQYYLAGFLNMHINLVEELYLPLKFSVTIEHPMDNEGKRERKFSPIKVIFNKPNQSIGGSLNTKGEYFNDVIEHRSPIVNKDDDSMTFMITIDFDVDPKDCVEAGSLNKT